MLKNRRASVSVELALTFLFVLLPLLGAGADGVLLISAQAQLNTALQALDYFAFTNPTAATNTTDTGTDIIGQINNASIYHIIFPAITSSGVANASLSYGCLTPGQGAATTFAYQSTPCAANQTQQTFVTYQVKTTVPLLIPLPGYGSSFPLSATGSVQTQ